MEAEGGEEGTVGEEDGVADERESDLDEPGDEQNGDVVPTPVSEFVGCGEESQLWGREEGIWRLVPRIASISSGFDFSSSVSKMTMFLLRPGRPYYESRESQLSQGEENEVKETHEVCVRVTAPDASVNDPDLAEREAEPLCQRLDTRVNGRRRGEEGELVEEGGDDGGVERDHD